MNNDYRYWKVELIVAIPTDHDVTGVDVVLESMQYDVETIVLDTSEFEMKIVPKGENGE